MGQRTCRKVICFCLLAGAFAFCRAAWPQEASLSRPADARWLSQERGPKTSDEGSRRSAGRKILMYPVNRAADLLDVLSLNLGFGMGLRANGHATRAAQFGAGAGVMSKVGMDGRHFGLFNESRSEFSLLCLTAEHYERTPAFGFIPRASTSQARDRLYLDVRRFTGVGVGADLLLFGFEAEAKPSELVDFAAGFAGIDFRRDDYPRAIVRPDYDRFYAEYRRGMDRMVFVASRVTDSPFLRGEAREGVTVYDKRVRSAAWLGELGMATGRAADEKAGRDFARYMKEGGDYDPASEVSMRLARTLRDRTSIQIVPPTALAEFENQKVDKRLGGETIRRLPNYKGLCEAFGADAVCDVRLLEWSLVRDGALGQLKVRLNVECKIVRQPQGRLLADIAVVTDDKGKRGGSLMDFAKDDGRLLRFETEQAVERVVSVLADRLLEP